MQAKCKRRLRAKAGAFAYEEGKGWSLRLRGGQRLEPSLTREGKGRSLRLRGRAKAGAFAYEEGKGWSLRLLLPFVEDAKK
jgi:hypothetical protein